jgi:hypothetical protein
MIFAHIAGLSNDLINKIINKYKNKYIFKNIEDYTKIIINDKNMKSLIQRYEYYYEKSKTINITKLQSKQFLKKSKDIEQKMNIYWKNKMNYYILELINKSDPKKKIILFGYCNFFKNIRIFIKIQAKILIFANINSIDYVKEIIRNNLKNYSEDIINGNYNLDLLNLQYLIKKREILINIYIKKAYDLKTYDNIINLLTTSIQTFDNPSILYFSSIIEYNKKINLKKLIAYSYDWISLVSAFNNKNIIKGFINDDESNPFIQELEPKLIQLLSNNMYLYVITDTALFTPIFTKNYIYKYSINKPVTIYKKILIKNVLLKLKEKKIKLIYK